ncbi:MAG: ABC transporter permease [Thermoplasmata archaeon]|nr:ABC transporter permease [Thermoplasmata archaeon]
MSTKAKSKEFSGNLPFFNEVRVEKMRLAFGRLSDIAGQILKNPLGATGIAILAVFTALAILGPSIAPYDTSNLGEGKWSKPSDFATDSPEWPKLALLMLTPIASLFVSSVALIAAFKRTPSLKLNKVIQITALAVSVTAAGFVYVAYLLEMWNPGESIGLLILPAAVLSIVSAVLPAKVYKGVPKPLVASSALMSALAVSVTVVGLILVIYISERLTELADYTDALVFVTLTAAAGLAALMAVEYARTPKQTPNKGMRLMSFVSSAATAGLLILALVANTWDMGERPGLWGSITGEWLDVMYLFTILGACLVMVSNGTRRRLTKTRKIKRWIGIICALAPIALMLGPAVGVLPQDQKGDYLLAIYAFSGVLILASGVCFYSAFKRPHAVVTRSERRGVIFPTRISTIAEASAMTLGSVLILAGFVAYLTDNWTTHWLGTDTFEADIFSKLLYGARTSMIVGIFSAVIASVLGAVVGLYSGYVGGRIDEVIMRANDVVLSIPWLVLMIIVAALIGTIDLLGIILIIGLTGWSPTARMVRAQVLSIRERQYIERARAIGASDLGIIRRHVLPNSFPLVFANTILTVAVSILSEATLSFLGMRPIGVVTWGTMLSFAQNAGAFTIGLHWWIIAPGLCIVMVVLGFTLLGYALDDILNPKLRKR